MLETLYLVEDVYSQVEIDEAMDATDVKKAGLDLARQIVQGLEAPFEPEELSSDYRRDLRELLEAKLRGEEISVPEPTRTRSRRRSHRSAEGERRSREGHVRAAQEDRRRQAQGREAPGAQGRQEVS